MNTSNHKPFAIQRIKTKDLWESAFMLAKGGQLEDVCLRPNGRKREVFFILTGNNIQNLNQEFKSGQATCHIGSLRASMTHLKEEMYKII